MQQGPIKIDLQAVIRAKLGRKSRWIPRFMVRGLERLICQDQLNRLLEVTYPATGAEFCRGVFKDLGVTVSACGTENLPDTENRRVIIVSNHPLGGLDGMALIDFFERRYGGRIHFPVNDFLMAVKPLEKEFVPINKHGRQSRQAMENLDRIFAGNDPIIIFPAGLCSRLQKGNVIADLEWKKMFVAKAREYHRDIIPVFFEGLNSKFFYKFARWRKRSGLKFNIEMILLPREVFKSRGKNFVIHCGQAIPWQSLETTESPTATAQNIKQTVYQLKSK